MEGRTFDGVSIAFRLLWGLTHGQGAHADALAGAGLNCLSALVGIDTRRYISGVFTGADGGLNCLSALVGIDTTRRACSPALTGRGLNCLSALVGIDTSTIWFEGELLRYGLNCLSALVGIDTPRLSAAAWATGTSLNCLSALVGIDTIAWRVRDGKSKSLSQLPFGSCGD